MKIRQFKLLMVGLSNLKHLYLQISSHIPIQVSPSPAPPALSGPWPRLPQGVWTSIKMVSTLNAYICRVHFFAIQWNCKVYHPGTSIIHKLICVHICICTYTYTYFKKKCIETPNSAKCRLPQGTPTPMELHPKYSSSDHVSRWLRRNGYLNASRWRRRNGYVYIYMFWV